MKTQCVDIIVRRKQEKINRTLRKRNEQFCNNSHNIMRRRVMPFVKFTQRLPLRLLLLFIINEQMKMSFFYERVINTMPLKYTDI